MAKRSYGHWPDYRKAESVSGEPPRSEPPTQCIHNRWTDQCVQCAAHDSRPSTPAPSEEPPDLHTAICLAVSMMNVGNNLDAHTVLRKALVRYADAQQSSPAEFERLRRKQLDAEQAWEFLQSKGVTNLDIEREGKDKVTLTELLAEFGNGVYIGRDESSPVDLQDEAIERMKDIIGGYAINSVDADWLLSVAAHLRGK